MDGALFKKTEVFGVIANVLVVPSKFKMLILVADIALIVPVGPCDLNPMGDLSPPGPFPPPPWSAKATVLEARTATGRSPPNAIFAIELFFTGTILLCCFLSLFGRVSPFN